MRKILISSIIALIALIGLSSTVKAADASTLQAIIDEGKDEVTITLDQNYEGKITIQSGKNITINLNNRTLKSTTSDTIVVELGATLIITGEGEIINDNGNAAVFNNGTTIINGGIIRKTDKQYYNIANHGIMTINGGTVINETTYVSGKSYASLFENGYYDYGNTDPRKGYIKGINQENPTLIINNGEFNGGLNTIKNDDGATLVVNNGIFKNQIQVAIFNVNDATINGGTFNVPQGEDKTTIFNRNYNISTDIGKLIITGGTFNADYFIETNSNIKGEVTITGGIFNTQLGIVNSLNRPDVELNINGGLFNQEPKNSDIVSGYVVEKTASNKYAVKLNEVSSELPEINEDSKEVEIGVSEEIKSIISGILKEEAEKNEKVKEALDNRKEVKVEVKIEKMKKEDISQEEKEKIEEFMTEGEIAQYFDITLLIKADGEEIGKIEKVSNKLAFKLLIPEELMQENREFYIVKIHEGKVEKIEATQENNELLFDTDEFSTYALAYEDKVQSEEKDQTPKTGELNIGLYVCIALSTISAVAAVKSKLGKHSK